MKLLVIETELFPDGDTVEAAIAMTDANCDRVKLDGSTNEWEFDQAAAAILAADLIITI